MKFIKKVLSRIGFNAPVTLCVTGASLAALLLGLINDGAITRSAFMIYRAPFSFMECLRLFTHVLGHADWAHFSGNIAVFLILAPIAEEKYGTWRFLLLILLTALVTGGANLLLSPTAAVCGLSGVCYMLMLLTAATGSQKNKIPLTLILVAIISLGGEAFSGIFRRDSISQLSHVIGGLLGGAAGLWLNPGRKQV